MATTPKGTSDIARPSAGAGVLKHGQKEADEPAEPAEPENGDPDTNLMSSRSGPRTQKTVPKVTSVRHKRVMPSDKALPGSHMDRLTLGGFGDLSEIKTFSGPDTSGMGGMGHRIGAALTHADHLLRGDGTPRLSGVTAVGPETGTAMRPYALEQAFGDMEAGAARELYEQPESEPELEPEEAPAGEGAPLAVLPARGLSSGGMDSQPIETTSTDR